MSISVVSTFEKAVQLARQSAWQSDEMVGAAVGSLDEPITLPGFPTSPVDSGLSLEGGQNGLTTGLGDDPFGFETVVAPAAPPSAKTTDLGVIEAPDLSSPPATTPIHVSSVHLGAIPTAPLAPDAVDLETAPSVALPWTPPTNPALVDVTPLTDVTLDVDLTTDFPDTPLTATFDEAAFATAFEHALGALPAGLPDSVDAPVRHALPLWLEQLRAGLAAETQQRVTGVSAALLQRLDAQMGVWIAGEQARLATATASATESGWGLPSALDNALRQQAQREQTRLEPLALTLTVTKTAELALQHAQFVTELYAKFRETTLELKLQETQMLLRAVEFARRYAQAQNRVLLKVFEGGKLLQADVNYRRDGLRLKRAESELEIALAKQLLARAQIGVEKARGMLTDAQTEQLETEEAALGALSEGYAGEVAALRNEQRRREITLQWFELQVRLALAKGSVREAQVRAFQAEMTHDAAQQAAELKKLEYFNEQVAAFEDQLAVIERADAANAKRNDYVLSEYKARVRERLFPLRTALLKNEYDLRAYQASAEQFIATKDLEIKRTAYDIEALRDERSLDEVVHDLFREVVRDEADQELSRLDALARSYLDAAGVMAGMSEAAASSINTLTDSMLTQTS